MPEITVIHIVLIALAVVIGAVIGWVIRSSRAAQEKAAITTGWQERVEAQGAEQHRLALQNKGLMDQVSQFQDASREAKTWAKQLSTAVQDGNKKRDDLQREIQDIRSNLEVTVRQRDELQSALAAGSDAGPAMRQKDEKIFQLSRELEDWQNRLPPLIERYKLRNQEAEQLEADLAAARLRIDQLEGTDSETSTRIEPVRDPDALTDGRDASNDPTDDEYDQDNRPDEIADDEYSGTPRDDLKQIKGVGPSIEKTLNEMGVYRFQQIANMSEYDIDRVAQRLKGFHSRIYREDWIGQARILIDNQQNI